MEHFSNILCFISTLNDNINDPNFPINFKIIFLAERIFYQNKTTGDKIYLCAKIWTWKILTKEKPNFG